MKHFFLLSLWISLRVVNATSGQQSSEILHTPFLCDCSAFGFSTTWADSNKVSCFTIPVPRNSLSPESGHYSLAVVVAKALENTKQLPLLYLHGGPGIATVENVKRYLGSPTWKLLRENRDILFFDYRGTGFSEPSLCGSLEDSLAAYMMTNPNEEQIETKEISLYRECREAMIAKDIHLADFTSHQLAADAEAIRTTLHIPQWNIYGVSFGTTVALNILRSFPMHVTSAILDSPFPPNAPWNDFVRPFDTCFTVLEKNILQDPSLGQFHSIRKDYVKAVTRLNNNPVDLAKASDADTTRQFFSGDDFAWSIWSAMLRPATIPYVPLAIREIANGNDSILPLWSTAFNSPDAYGKFSAAQSHAILCYEARPQKEEDKEAYLLTRYPDFSSFNSAYDTRLCEAWRPEVPNKEIFEPVVSDIPVLILSGEFDPVCPPVFGDIAARTLGNSTHIIVPSASHAAIHADDCLRHLAHDFLKSPHHKPDAECVYQRKKIAFVTEDLASALKNY